MISTARSPFGAQIQIPRQRRFFRRVHLESPPGWWEFSRCENSAREPAGGGPRMNLQFYRPVAPLNAALVFAAQKPPPHKPFHAGRNFQNARLLARPESGAGQNASPAAQFGA